ncbi:MAG: hypothetical protein JRF33_09290 [Deltaproteobacteria bacterium]|nr:hypothetical protein [Deltaproteobacteria bacterium]
MLEVLQEGGLFAWLAAGLGIVVNLAILVGFIVALATGSRGLRLVFGFIGLFGAGCLWLLGWIGHDLGVSLVHGALAYADPGESLVLMFKGHQETTGPMQVALWMSLLPVFFGMVLLVVGFGMPPKASTPTESMDGQDARVWVAGLCGAVGAGLALVATAAYCVFDAFYLPMMFLV